MKEKQVVTQIMDSALNEALYLQRLQEGSTEIYIEERDIDLETIVIPLEEMETIDGSFLQNMWQVTVIARFEQNGKDQERMVRGWRYLPLYR
jgi:glutamine cyclotransferase